MYKVKFPTVAIEKKFFKELAAVSPRALQERILNTALSLAGNPRPKGEPKIVPPLEVYHYVAQYRLHVANWRILYDVSDSTKTVWIFALKKRDERTYR
jgi:mRNA-degrading endonuclease RelE of RelBE toxin-antitoxin system